MDTFTQLTMALLGSGVALAFLVLIVANVRLSKNKKALGGPAGFLLTLSILSLAGGAGSVVWQNKIPPNIKALSALKINAPQASSTSSAAAKNAKAAASAIPKTTPKANASKSSVLSKSSQSRVSQSSTSKSENSSSQAASSTPFIQAAFDPNGSVRPKIVTDKFSKDLTDAIIDADGTETFLDDSTVPYAFVVRPDKIAYGYYVFEGEDYHPKGADLFLYIPDGTTIAGKGHGCKQDEFMYDPVSDNAFVSQNEGYYTDGLTYKSIPDSPSKLQNLDVNSINPHSFLEQMLPENTPAKTVENHILNGAYKYVDQQIVNSTTPITMNFQGNTVDFCCDYLDMNGSYVFKLEPLGKNAYKLYLYPKMDNVDDNGSKSASVSTNAEKLTFFIYMDSQNSFDFVFFTDIHRNQVTMTR